jgi:hypothetical protein
MATIREAVREASATHRVLDDLIVPMRSVVVCGTKR